MTDDATKPRRADIFPDEVQENLEENTGPGCMVWSMLGLFAVVMALAIVFGAAYLGFNSGLVVAKTTATAVRNQNIATQCAILPTDIAAAQEFPERMDTIQGRFENLAVNGLLPSCAEVFVPQATTIYLQSIATATATPSSTPSPSPTPQAEVTQAVVAITTAPTSSSGYDLDALFLEAQNFIAAANYDEAIRTLDAILAIDPNFQSQTVNTMLFNALKQEAYNNFRLPNGSLQEGIILANRAATFGDIGELGFERDVASLYMDAVAYVNVDYGRAISLLNQVLVLSIDYKDTRSLLYGQYVAYADAYALGFDPCNAVIQYQAALQMRPNTPDVQTKLDAVQQACASGVPATIDPNATPDPNAAQITPTQGIAPVGQGN